ncbi:hypothetical protein PoB_002074000 [Plakobranchus ocellatus]|uniref:Uncharacterized protein n=1 Tax=Plakobranchus ocellatus TaxID=259542 RepID=A0AAV3ZF55_9GAST|nr:hypothetical protein PoB_002074000 [Plakobranchus ocellatus]
MSLPAEVHLWLSQAHRLIIDYPGYLFTGMLGPSRKENLLCQYIAVHDDPHLWSCSICASTKCIPVLIQTAFNLLDTKHIDLILNGKAQNTHRCGCHS